MSRQVSISVEFELSGIDGTNPLGFLAALGTLVTAHGAGETRARLGFRRRSTWRPFIAGVSVDTPEAFAEIVARGLEGRRVPDDAERRRAEAQKEFDAAKRACDHKKKEIQTRRLKGKERATAIAAELQPLEQVRDEKRRLWLDALAEAVPRPELALGKQLNCTVDEYRDHALAFRDVARRGERETVDLLAAFGSDGCRAERSDAIQSTPFCFITGSGHQYFLDTVRQLMDHVHADRVRAVLFEPWTYSDEGLSMRWDPSDDRRYALMDRDPTASDNKSRTVWMANLLAYRALVLVPCAPRASGLVATGWDNHGQQEVLTWPLWEFAAEPDTVRSMLQQRELHVERPDRKTLQARGVVEVLRARRIKVGTGTNFKWNFSPARSV